MTLTDDPVAIVAALRLEDGARWGEVATDWQVDDVRAVLTPADGDPRQHWLGRPKGGSKSTDLGAVAIAWLLAVAAPLDEGYVIASDQDQARRLLTRAAGLITRTPGLADRLEVQSWAIVNRSTGAKVIAVAADAAGLEGIVTPLIMLDELPQWGDTISARAMWDAAFSSVPKGARLPGGIRFVVIGHAGIEGRWQHKLFEQAVSSSAWRVNDVPGPLPWIDAELLEDQRQTLTGPQFARRHLNQWSSAEDSLTTLEDLRACVTLDGPLRPVAGTDYVIALDVGLVNDRTVAAVLHAEDLSPQVVSSPVPRRGERERLHAMASGRHLAPVRDPLEARPTRIVLDRMAVWQGSKRSPVSLSEVEAWVIQAHQSFNGAPLRCDPWQTAGMAQRLRSQGLVVDEFTFSASSVGRLAATLHQLLRSSALALPDDDELLEELAHVRLIEKAGGLRMDHASGRHDDRAVVLAMGAAFLLDRPASSMPSVMAYENVALVGTR